MFVIPSVKRPGEAILTWGVAQQHLPWGILLLLGAGFAMADGCQVSLIDGWMDGWIDRYAAAPSMGDLVATRRWFRYGRWLPG